MCAVNKETTPISRIWTRYKDAKAQSSILLLDKLELILAVIALTLFFFLMSDRFIAPYNILNIARQMVSICLLGIGVTFVLVGSGVDLSIGANMSLTSIVMARVMIASNSIILGLFAAILVGVTFGIVNGYIVAYRNVQPFAVSLGTMSVGNGIAYVLSSGNTIRGLPESFAVLGNGDTFGIPNQIFLLVAVCILTYFLLQKTTFGARCYAIGGNQSTAKLSGIPVRKIRMLTFILCGSMASLASIVASSRVISGNPTLGADMPPQAIAAAIIGGASMSGGRGNIGGTIIGCIFISVLYSGLNFINVSPYVQDVLIGAVIIGSAWIDANKRRKLG